jgi:hypothetical protein
MKLPSGANTAHAAALAICVAACLSVHAADPDGTSEKTGYSPYARPDASARLLWGDTHVHTSYSADAGMAGCRLGPDEAYRFARGEQVTSSTGQPVRLLRPYDFLVVADHAENLGLAPMIAASDPLVLQNPTGKRWHDMVAAGKGFEAFADWIHQGSTTGRDPIDSPEMMRAAWDQIIASAERFDEPGRFTALIGFEWTSTPSGNNLHRNVLFRDDGERARQVLPFSAYDSDDPQQLWQWMQAYEDRTGGRVLAIPHNGNLSNGTMFATTTRDGRAFDRAYAETRARREPLYEVTQPKGTGEAHPLLSPEDEFAGFEVWDKSNLGGNAATNREMLPGNYARTALLNGLALQQRLGTNPFRFGLIGSTDTHTGLSTPGEDNFFGKTVGTEPQTARWQHAAIPAMKPELVTRGWELGASGMVAVWAKDNTRAAIFDALERREAYGTTGTRISVRLFAGWELEPGLLERSDFAEQGYAHGVPMGGELRHAPARESPVFLVRALRDPDGANLDRIQFVKGWVDANGAMHERIFDVAVSGGRAIGADGRTRSPVGSTVDVGNARYANTIGAPELAASWRDPDFDPAQHAFYYVRVLEIPTPRWTAFDAKRFGITMPPEVAMELQERAYTSPVWYTP